MSEDLLHNVSASHVKVGEAIAEFQADIAKLSDFGERLRATYDAIGGDAIPFGAKVRKGGVVTLLTEEIPNAVKPATAAGA